MTDTDRLLFVCLLFAAWIIAALGLIGGTP